MLLWLIAATATAIVCAALYFASAGRRVNAGAAEPVQGGDPAFRQRLEQIERDMATGRLSEVDGSAAKAELAREILRYQQDRAREAGLAARPIGRLAVLASSVAIAVIAFGLYAYLGQPGLPAQPLVARADLPSDMSLPDAVLRIEAQMAKTPEDVRGWAALGPAYLQLGRLEDAVKAYRRIVELSPATAENQSDLAEVLMMAQGGDATGEPLALFRNAVAIDPGYARARFYLAGEATRTGQYAEAVRMWQELLALSKGGESWVEVARRGLEVAQAGLAQQSPASPQQNGGGLTIELAPQDGSDARTGPTQPTPSADAGATQPLAQNPQIRAMVDGLQARLGTSGGSIEEWTRLVRSWIVLGETDAARTAYTAAVAAYPDAAVRAELDAMAQGAGLVPAGSGVSE